MIVASPVTTQLRTVTGSTSNAPPARKAAVRATRRFHVSRRSAPNIHSSNSGAKSKPLGRATAVSPTREPTPAHLHALGAARARTATSTVRVVKAVRTVATRRVPS